MNDPDDPNDFSWYLKALAGERGELSRGDPKSGYYRDRNRAVAIWRDGENTLLCEVSSGYCPKDFDEIDELFGFVSQQPIPYDVYTEHLVSGKWPEDLPEDVSEFDPTETDPDIIYGQLVKLMVSFNDWLKTMPAGINNDLEDARVAKYAARFGEFKKQSDDRRKLEKEPYLEGCRAIDAKWNPVIDAAESGKRAVLDKAVEYRKKRDEVERKARVYLEEKIRKHQEIEAERGERVIPVSLPPKKPSGLRTVRTVEIISLQDVAHQLAIMNDPPKDFVEVCRKISHRLLLAGTPVRGARLIEEKRAN